LAERQKSDTIVIKSRREDPNQKKIVKTAAGNWENGKKVIQLLLNRDGGIQIIKKIIKTAAWN
jgi:hypothetical protein